MATAKRNTRKRKTTTRARKKRVSRLNFKGILYTLLLATFFFFSVGVLTYVIFFRMVVAAELQKPGDQVMFEEPFQPMGLPYGSYGNGGATQTSEPKFAIIIDDMGYHFETGKNLIQLNLDLSFSFLPRAPFTHELEKMAYRQGRAVLLHLPLQPRDSNWDPGGGALFLEEQDNQKEIFLYNLSLVPYAIGVNNHMGSLYTENMGAMRTLLQHIFEKKLFFIDSFTTSHSVGYSLAKKLGVATARRDLFLDNILDIGTICSQIDELVKLAQGRGKAIGIAHPHQQTYDAIQSCLEGVQYPAQLVSVDTLLD